MPESSLIVSQRRTLLDRGNKKTGINLQKVQAWSNKWNISPVKIKHQRCHAGGCLWGGFRVPRCCSVAPACTLTFAKISACPLSPLSQEVHWLQCYCIIISICPVVFFLILDQQRSDQNLCALERILLGVAHARALVHSEDLVLEAVESSLRRNMALSERRMRYHQKPKHENTWCTLWKYSIQRQSDSVKHRHSVLSCVQEIFRHGEATILMWLSWDLEPIQVGSHVGGTTKARRFSNCDAKLRPRRGKRWKQNASCPGENQSNATYGSLMIFDDLWCLASCEILQVIASVAGRVVGVDQQPELVAQEMISDE